MFVTERRVRIYAPNVDLGNCYLCGMIKHVDAISRRYSLVQKESDSDDCLRP